MPESRQVSYQDGEKLASQLGIQFLETSAKDNVNVDEMFNSIIRLALKAKKTQLDKSSGQSKMLTKYVRPSYFSKTTYSNSKTCILL